MRRFVSALLLVLLVAVVASACGGAAAPSQPSQNTPRPATKTPAPVVGTPRPPTVTPFPGGPLAGKKTLANGVWECPVNTSGAKYVGSLEGNEYHRLDCPTAIAIAAQDRVCFVDEKAALKFGYLPAADCSPP